MRVRSGAPQWVPSLHCQSGKHVWLKPREKTCGGRGLQAPTPTRSLHPPALCQVPVSGVCVTDVLLTLFRSLPSVRASISWEWSVGGISRTAVKLTSRTMSNVDIYHCKNVFLIKIRKWKASWEQSLPTGFLWKLTRSNEVWNWPTFKKPPKLQKRKWNSEIWPECKWKRYWFLVRVSRMCGWSLECRAAPGLTVPRAPLQAWPPRLPHRKRLMWWLTARCC